ncbi:MAG: YraN family protein [Woeseiaceae bacterium]
MGTGRAGSLGNKAERVALDFLVGKGLTPVGRNFQRRGGEIDLIMLHDDCLVFVEVRYRTSTRYSRPELTVDSRKQQKIIRTAALFLADSRQYAEHAVRFDVVAITAADQDRIRWIHDAFRPENSAL